MTVGGDNVHVVKK